ncbi:MAG: DHHA1 domain-containing protein [Patescibacteria group bacterium]
MKKKEKKNNIVILYHKGCPDGFGAAWAAYKKFGAKATYIAMARDNAVPPSIIKDAFVFILDFSFPPPIMKKIVEEAKLVVALDHHISAEKETKMAHEHRYQLNHSGAVIAWNYFFPKKKVPKLLQHVEDVDIWKWKLSHTREISSALSVRDFDFTIWNKFARDLENAKTCRKIIDEGAAIFRYQETIIRKAVGIAEVVTFQGHRVLASNFPHLVSEIGAALIERVPPMAIMWSERSGKIIVSLRSNGKVDVSKIAEKYGGGGHKRAAAFAFSADKKFPWKRVKK